MPWKILINLFDEFLFHIVGNIVSIRESVQKLDLTPFEPFEIALNNISFLYWLANFRSKKFLMKKGHHNEGQFSKQSGLWSDVGGSKCF